MCFCNKLKLKKPFKIVVPLDFPRKRCRLFYPIIYAEAVGAHFSLTKKEIKKKKKSPQQIVKIKITREGNSLAFIFCKI